MYIIRVKPQKEDEAKISLEKRGYKTIVPKVMRLERRLSKWDKVQRKIFCGYIFLDESNLSDKDYTDIKGNDFVLGFLGEGCIPYKMTNNEEILIRYLDNFSGIIELESQLELFKEYKVKGLYARVMHIDKRRSRATFKFYIGDIEHYITLIYKIKDDIKEE